MLKARYLIYLLMGIYGISIGQESQIIFSNINIVDVNKGKVVPFQTVFVEDGVIAQIKPFDQTTAEEKEMAIEMRGHFIMPGLVDGHIHLFQSGGLYTRPDAIDLQQYRSYEDEKEWLKENVEDLLKRYVRVGVTSVMDIGGPMYQLEMRDTLNKKPYLPNLWITGPLVSTYQPAVYDNDEPPIIKVDSTDAARQMVRDQLSYRPDFIKIWYIVFPGQSPEVNLPIVQATIEEAHQNGLRAAVHATQLETARLAVQAGADILVHSVGDKLIDDDFVKLLLDSSTIYIPTLIVGDKYDEVFGQRYKPTKEDYAFANPWTLGSLFDLKHLPEKKMIDEYHERASDTARLAKMLRLRQLNLRKLADAGVFIATGTDAGNIGTLHASSYFEEVDQMKKAGMSNAQILTASTINGARILGKDSLLGSIDVGKQASFVIYKKNPIYNLDAIKDPLYVYHNEQFIKVDTFLRPGAAELAQLQLNAYNTGNVGEFLKPYDDNVRLFQYPSSIIYAGKDQMLHTYGEMFSRNPNLHCELVNRTVIGNKVIDHERIYGLGKPFEAVAIYVVENGKIKDVRFLSK
jgi:imidazolonepropionase-like amidohydrolase